MQQKGNLRTPKLTSSCLLPSNDLARKMKTHVEKYCEQTSLVGLHYAIDAPYKLERVFWAVCFAISLFLALWMVKDAVHQGVVKILKMTFELGAIVFSMGLYIYKWEKYRKYIFLVVQLGIQTIFFIVNLYFIELLGPIKSDHFNSYILNS